MKEKITLITYFNESEQNKIKAIMSNIKQKTCKVPYFLDDDVKRHNVDIMPYHFTIFGTDKDNQDKVLDVLKKNKINKIKVKIDKLKLIQSVKSGAYILYFGIEKSQELIELQRLFFKEIPEERGYVGGSFYTGDSEKEYDSSNYVFHMTLHVTRNEEEVKEMYKIINENFTPFYMEFNRVALYDDRGGDLIKII